MSDNGALLILTDDRSHILYVYGHSELLKSLSVTYNIRPGTSVSEDSVGTNAVALALYYKEMQIIKGSQHYCELFKTWTCIAIPIQIFNNEIIGSICVATPFISSLCEKIALTNYISSNN